MLANLLNGYKKEKSDIESELSELQVEIFKTETQAMDMTQEIENLKQYAEITELNRKIVTNLIQAIYISEPVKNDGQKVYDIEIRYKFQSAAVFRMMISARQKRADKHSFAFPVFIWRASRLSVFKISRDIRGIRFQFFLIFQPPDIAGIEIYIIAF